jgi:hypothetical protein
MERITINGRPADITLETEKTVGELLLGIDAWLNGTGIFLSGLELDGKIYGALSMDGAFELPLDTIDLVDIKTSGWAELFLEALAGLKGDLSYIEEAAPGERQDFLKEWEHSPVCAFLEQNASEIKTAFIQAASGTAAPSSLVPMLDERIRELCDPAAEIGAILPLCGEIASRLEDLPLDMQTGKDSRAAETILFFSGVSEKMFRLFMMAKYYGAAEENLKGLLEDFSAAVKELLSAYENRDTVLVGDLAEYELAPRLLTLSGTLRGFSFSKKEGVCQV